MTRIGLVALSLSLAACAVAMDPAEDPGVRSPDGAVAPTQCPSGAPRAFPIFESPPPLTMKAGETAMASVTFANCSGVTWNAVELGAGSGYKLGTDGPRDVPVWTPSTRLALPTDVPPGYQVTIAIPMRAPSVPGSYGYSWGIVHEGVEWLSASSPSHTITVAATKQTVTLCNGVDVDAGGVAPASPGIQACIDAAPEGGTLELPPGVYRVTEAIRIDRPLTLRSAGIAHGAAGCLDSNGPPCAALRADDQLQVKRGFLRIGGTSAVTIDHLILDGNRAHRLASAAAADCRAGTNGSGMNASVAGCTDCAFVGSASIDALCGSGLEWVGDGVTVAGSLFRGNGDHNSNMMWSDGLTLLRSNGATVEGNRFEDNSDVDLILGGAANARVTNNQIVQSHQGAFAGLMLDNFNGSTPGDFTGATVDGNRISCGNLLCDFGIQLGPHPWYPSQNIAGGRVTGNTVSGAKLGLDVEGGGTDGEPIFLGGNDIGPSPASATFLCGARPSTSFNVSPDSRVLLGDGPQPTAHMQFHDCP